MTYFREFCYLNSSWIRKSITWTFMSSSRNKFTLLYQNLVTDVFVGFCPPCWCPSRWAPARRIQISINLGKTFLRISRIRNILLTWILARNLVYIYLISHPRFRTLSIDTVSIFILIYFEWRTQLTLKTSNRASKSRRNTCMGGWKRIGTLLPTFTFAASGRF